MQLPDRADLRQTLAGFDTQQRKIVGGVLAVMFQHPERVREREWISEQFTEVCLLAGEFSTVEEAQSFVQASIHELLNACYALFACVGEDLSPRTSTEPVSREDAMLRALDYLGAPPA